MAGEYSGGNSCVDRNLARVLELKRIMDIMERLSDRIELKDNSQRIYVIESSRIIRSFDPCISYGTH